MNKNLLPICALCLAVLLMKPRQSQTAASIRVFKDPAYPGKCAVKFDIILNEGQEVRDPYTFCGTIICGKDSVVESYSCGVEAVKEGCKFGETVHPKSDYPGCCERHVIC